MYTLDLCIISATDLWTVEDEARVFVDAKLISGLDEPAATRSTPTASATHNNPISWNFPIHFAISDLFVPNGNSIGGGGVIVSLQVRCEYHLGDLRYEEDIGEVYLPVDDLLDVETQGSSQFVTYNIHDRSGAPIGELNLSYKFTDDGDSHRWLTPTPRPSAPPMPDPLPSAPAAGRGRVREFPLKVAMLMVAAALVAPQMGELLMKVRELVVGVIALALVFLVVFGFLISLLNLLQRFAAS